MTCSGTAFTRSVEVELVSSGGSAQVYRRGPARPARFLQRSTVGVWITAKLHALAQKKAELMHIQRLLLAGMLLGVVPLRAQSGWIPLWNGRDLDGWTTWMRQPEPSSAV